MPPRSSHRGDSASVGMISSSIPPRAGYSALLFEKWNPADRRAPIRAMELPTRRPASSILGCSDLVTVECFRRIPHGSSRQNRYRRRRNQCASDKPMNSKYHLNITSLFFFSSSIFHTRLINLNLYRNYYLLSYCATVIYYSLRLPFPRSYYLLTLLFWIILVYNYYCLNESQMAESLKRIYSRAGTVAKWTRPR